MNLKLRFAILFTLIVAIILLLSSLSIYFFYSNNRKVDYQNRLKSEAVIFFEKYIDQQLFLADSVAKIGANLDAPILFGDITMLFDEDKKPILSNPNSLSIKVSSKTFSNIKTQKEFYYKVGYREFVGIYFEKEKKYVVASAMDRSGLKKLIRLRFILLGVFFVGIVSTIIISYIFVKSALKPLSKLSNQIKQTTKDNLWQKVDEGNAKDEVSQIAANYNVMIERLNKAFELQKNFVHYASHELRTPLAVMYSTTEAALYKKLSEQEYKNVLISLKDDQNNLIELTNSLLLLSQFERLQTTPSFKMIRVDELIYEAIEYSKKNFNNIIIDFQFDNIPEEDDLMIPCNDALLKSAFNNLIKNAYFYSSDKKLLIRLVAKPNEMQIHFENKGVSLAESIIENMENPFANGELIGIAKGIGLGLSIVQKIATLHKGHFEYKALPNGINRFTIKLK
jgi:signal transduction histidine kinase